MWIRIRTFFKDSEVIFLARLQVVAGILWSLAVFVLDPSVSTGIQQLLPAKYLPYFLIALGVLTEYARRRRATDLDPPLH